jgi:uncharacterized protein
LASGIKSRVVNVGKRWALVTGGSKGIGLELSKLFAKAGYNLVVVARHEKALEEVKNELEGNYGVKVLTISIDLSIPDSSKKIYNKLQKEKIQIGILVNNAGFGNYGPFARTDWETEEREMQLNMISLVQLTKLIMPQMLAKGDGKIMNVASTAAFQPGPFMAIYYATKAFVLSFSEALAEELEGTGIMVTALCPGPTRTHFQERAGVSESSLIRHGMMDAKDVAKAGFEGLMSGKRIVIPGFKNKLGTKFVRMLPNKLVTNIIRKVQEGRNNKAN